MIPPEEAVLVCFNPGKKSACIMVYRYDPEMLKDRQFRNARMSGACSAGWSELTAEQQYFRFTKAMIDMVEFDGAPLRMARDRLDDLVNGYRIWHIKGCGR